jgi:hypothetical protein
LFDKSTGQALEMKEGALRFCDRKSNFHSLLSGGFLLQAGHTLKL